MTDGSTVVIIGAGLAGLALGQALKHAQPPVPFQIFERDSGQGFRAQGYRLRIMPDGAAALRALLPPHKWAQFEATCAPVAADGLGGWLFAATGNKDPPPELATAVAAAGPQDYRPPPPPVGRSYNADRAVLRNLLMDGLEAHVLFDKRFQRYQSRDDGAVQVFFADGSTACGRVLVGADGSHSAVRHQLLPSMTVVDTEGRGVFGKTLLDPAVSSRVPGAMLEGMCLTGQDRQQPVKMLTDPMLFSPDLEPRLRERLHVPQDYLYWVLVFRQDHSPRQNLDHAPLSHAESLRLSLDLTAKWHPSIRELMQQQLEEATSTLFFTICMPQDLAAQWQALQVPDSRRPGHSTLAQGPVTLVGDAAHPLTPVGAVGANTAFQDSRDLRDALVALEATAGRDELVDALQLYQSLMVPRAARVVGQSLAGARHFFGMRPIDQLVGQKQQQ